MAAGILMAITSGWPQAAGAQGKDPVRPPGGGADPGRVADPGPRGRDDLPAAPRTPEDGLARTGQDVAMQLSLGIGLAAIGAALRIVDRGTHPRYGDTPFPPGLGARKA